MPKTLHTQWNVYLHKLESLCYKEGQHAARACYHVRIWEGTEDTENAEGRAGEETSPLRYV
ncbi:hypothetical protein F4212_07290 [Candidatus Poribacteria bacterium]|nr:hypothetical protein [Candidatus Poribacteria bacterium]